MSADTFSSLFSSTGSTISESTSSWSATSKKAVTILLILSANPDRFVKLNPENSKAINQRSESISLTALSFSPASC